LPRPDPTGGVTAFPDPLAGLRGPTSKGGEGTEGGGRGRGGMGGEEGRGGTPEILKLG